MDQFRHNRVLFAGDAARQVSPFGARGANSGMQDADNLAWKLDLVLKNLARQTLLDTYHTERALAADENILNSTRATDFLTPKSDISKLFRNAVLTLAKDHPFARPLVNSGRLSTPSTYDAPNTSIKTVTPAQITPALRDRYLGNAPRALYLIRPDQHVAARWDTATSAQINAALNTATGTQ